MKVPTADLETLKPQRPDEVAFGVFYDEIDDFLEGKPVPEASAQTIRRQWLATMHKRALPVAPASASPADATASGVSASATSDHPRG